VDGITPRFWLPTAITFGRLILVPVTIYLILQDRFGAAFAVFVAAGVSDALDGFLARYFNAISRIGAFLDPLADKALVVAVFVTLGLMGRMPLWLVFLVVFRDILIVGGALLYHTLTHALRMEPLWISKANTTAQLLLAGLILAHLGLGVFAPDVTRIAMYVVAALTVLSGASYIWTWGRRAMAYEHHS
jgi:cardiolipin synthase